MIAKLSATTAAAALALASLGAVTPAHAQTPADPDLRCAVWAMVAGAQEKDEAKKRGLGFMMSYFMGRYEGRTGGKIEAQIKPDKVGALIGNVADANKTCAAVAQSFGQRFDTTMQGMQRDAAAKSKAPANPTTAKSTTARPTTEGR